MPGMKKKDIVILANIEWLFLKQRHQNLAENLVDFGYNVIFVESAAKRNPQFADIPRIFSRLLKSVKTQTPHSDSAVNVVSPFVLPSTFKINRLFNKLFFVKKLASKISSYFKNDECILIIYAPTSTNLQLIDFLKPSKVIYDCVSNFEAFKEMPADTVQIENQLIKEANAVVVDCEFLLQKHTALSKTIKIIEPAVDFKLFNRFFKPQSRTELRKLIYYGQVDPLKIDINLLNFLAEKGITITIVGGVKSTDISNLIEILPVVKSDQLPEIINKFDAIILPYNVNDYTNGIIPAKFYECFATGLPIVATKMYNFLRYENLLITGNTYDEILEQINLFTISSDTEHALERIKIAQNNSWQKFTENFSDVIETA